MSLASFSLLLGAFYYIFGFPLVFGNQKYLLWTKKVLKDENMLRIFGAVLVSIAVTTLRYHYELSWDGEGLIIILAWICFVKGLLLAWFPAFTIDLREKIMKMLGERQTLQPFLGFVMVLLGALFTYLGLLLA
jgi:hypothetical protein